MAAGQTRGTRQPQPHPHPQKPQPAEVLRLACHSRRKLVSSEFVLAICSFAASPGQQQRGTRGGGSGKREGVEKVLGKGGGGGAALVLAQLYACLLIRNIEQ